MLFLLLGYRFIDVPMCILYYIYIYIHTLILKIIINKPVLPTIS